MVAAEEAAEPADSAPVRAATPAVTAAVCAVWLVVVAIVCANWPASQFATIFTCDWMNIERIWSRILMADCFKLWWLVIIAMIEDDALEPICSKRRL